MRILFLLTALLSHNSYGAVCSRTLTFTDGSVLTASQLNAEFNAITNCANSLNDANIASLAGISPTKLGSTIVYSGGGLLRDNPTGGLYVNVDGTSLVVNGGAVKVGPLGVNASMLAADAVTTSKILDANVTTAKIADASITQAKLAAGVNTAQMNSQTFTAASTSWVAPSGVTKVFVYGCGGGGGGGYSSGGGGAGAVARMVAIDVTPGNTYTVDVGAGGAGGVGASPNGVRGDPSGVNDGFVPLAAFFGGYGGTGSGGAGGKVSPSTTAGGDAGSAGMDSFNKLGGAAGQGGGGGAGDFGAGGAGGTGAVGSSAANNSCAGGGGGGSGAYNGGAGGSGKVILYWVGAV